jgi:hypothetical protein
VNRFLRILINRVYYKRDQIVATLHTPAGASVKARLRRDGMVSFDKGKTWQSPEGTPWSQFTDVVPGFLDEGPKHAEFYGRDLA